MNDLGADIRIVLMYIGIYKMQLILHIVGTLTLLYVNYSSVVAAGNIIVGVTSGLILNTW